MKKTSYLIKLIGLSIGLLVFVYTIHSFGGFQAVLTNLIQIKYYYVLIIVNSLIWMLLYTEGWHQLFTGIKHKIRYFSLLKIKMSGEGVNFMTPLGFMAGDPVRILLLRKFIGPEARMRSVVIDRVTHSLSAQFFCLIGILLIFTQDIDFPIWLHIFLLAIYFFLSLLFSSLIFSMISGRGFGIFENVIRLIGFILKKIHIRHINKLVNNLNNHLTDLRNNLEYYKDHPKHPFFISFVFHFLGRLLGAVEILIIFYCFEGHANFIFSYILATLTSFFSVVFGFIPGALGVLESLYANFFLLYGFRPEVGLSIQIVRRLRVLFWIGVGILILDYSEIADFFKKFRKRKSAQNQE